VVIETEVGTRDLVALSTSTTVGKEVSSVVDGGLAAVSPIVIFIDAEVPVAGTVISSIEGTVEFAEVVADSVTGSIERNLTEGVVNPTTGGGLVVGNIVVGVASDNRIPLAHSSAIQVAVEVIARSAATSAVEGGIVKHAATLVVDLEDNASYNVDVIRDSGRVAADVAPVPISAAMEVVEGLLDATDGSQITTTAAVAKAGEDVAEVVDAKTVSTLATVALGEVVDTEWDEALSLVNKARAIDNDAIGVALCVDAVVAQIVVNLATVRRITIAIGPASLADDVALTLVGISRYTNAIACATTIGLVDIDVVLGSPRLAAVVTAASIRLRIGDPRAIETIDDGRGEGGCRAASIQGASSLPRGALSESVSHGELATVLPVTVVVAAESIVASGLRVRRERLAQETTSVALRELDANGRKESSFTIGDDVRTSAARLNTNRALRPVGNE